MAKNDNKPKAQEPAVQEPAVVAVAGKKSVSLRSKVGNMVHPFKHRTFVGAKPEEFAEMDSWLQVQVDADKLEIVVE